MAELYLANTPEETVVGLIEGPSVSVANGPGIGRELLGAVGDILEKTGKRLVDMGAITATYDPNSAASSSQTVRITADILTMVKNVEN